MTNFRILIILSTIPVITGADDNVAIEKLSQDNFRLTLTSSRIDDFETAQIALLPAALSVCGEAYPEFGRYKFEKNELLGAQGASDAANSFVLVQDIECVASKPTADSPPANVAIKQYERAAVESTVRSLTRSYFSEILDGKFSTAYSRWSRENQRLQSLNRRTAEWKQFQRDSGQLLYLDLHTITLYDNPPNSPQPGLYVAVDYQNRFERAPYHCGYLVWFRNADGQFEIVREETGLLTYESVESIPQERLGEILEQFRCKAR